MRKSWIIGAVASLLVIGGVAVTWIGVDHGSVALTGTVAVAQEAADPHQAIGESGNTAVKQAIAAAGPAVVRIDVIGTEVVSNAMSDLYDDPFFRRFFGLPDGQGQRERQVQAQGSGFVFSFDGEKLVMTNRHVIDGANSIRVTDVDGNTWDATVVGSDELLDVAVLRLDGDTDTLAIVRLGDSDRLEIGDWSIAIGSPLGLSYTVTLGIVSALDRDVSKPDGVGQFYNLIQTDAAVNPGNSGGPLVNAYGEVVGINTMIANTSSSGVSIEGINFAVPINSITDILDMMVREGAVTRGYLGVWYGAITRSMEDVFGVTAGQGVLVSDVSPGSPAEEAGIEPGDVILKVDGTTITDTDVFAEMIGLRPVGTVVDLEILRGDQTITLSATLGERPSESEIYGVQDEEDATTTEAAVKFGLTVGPVTRDIADNLRLQSAAPEWS